MPKKAPNVLARFPEKLHPPTGLSPLFSPNRYKIFFGGRGAGKTWAIAASLLIRGTQTPLRILCTREFQSSIGESVHQTLVDTINRLELNAFYDIEQSAIKGKNGTTFKFAGIRHNINNIRSYEGTDVCWVEEASNVTKKSWDVLLPTIRRKANSEIIISFNPEHLEDETFQRFVIDPPPGAVVVKINWNDNPFLDPGFIDEIMEFKEKYPADYPHVYEGEPRKFLEGAVYAAQIRDALAKNQFREVTYEANGGPVETFWDLGFADFTAIWIAQKVGQEIRLLNYVENERKPLDWYLMLLNDKDKFPYPIERYHLPHDARAKSLGTGQSIEEMLRRKGHKVNIVPRLSVNDGINAVRSAFPHMYFDEQKCAAGIKAIGNYKYEVIDRQSSDAELKNEPMHDRWSHGADALRYLAIALRPPRKRDSGGNLNNIVSGNHFGLSGSTSWISTL